MISLLWLLACYQQDATPGAGPAASAAKGSFTLVYTGNVDGEIEPCG